MDIKILYIVWIIAWSIIGIIISRMLLNEKDYYNRKSKHYRQRYGQGWNTTSDFIKQTKKGYVDHQPK